MKEGTMYGNEFCTSWDGHASGKSPTPADCSSEEKQQQIITEEDPTEFKNADARLLNYHLFFSSKL